MSMTRAGATLLLMQIVMVCPMLLTPVTYMSGADKGNGLSQQMRAQFQANKERVLKILEEREWYLTFLNMLRKELSLKGADPHLIRADKIPMHIVDAPRVRRSARSVPTQENSKVEVSAALKVDGKVCLNVTKRAEAIRMGDSNEIIKADIGNTEILLSMKVTKKEADVASEEEALADASLPPRSEPPRPPAQPPPASQTPLSSSSNGGGGGVGGGGAGISDASTSTERPPLYIFSATTARPPASSGQNDSGKPGYSELQKDCADPSYCFFGGKCQYYGIINMQLCTCRKGYKGNRCELYDIQEVLTTLDTAHKRNVIGNGPISQEDHVDVLSVVESTALYLLHVPSSYPSEQALQLIDSILRH